ncbi:MAG: protein kinase domain-containing protein [Planctomycetota bacterium]
MGVGGSAREGGEPMLTDFGLAKDVASESKMTHSGVTIGTPHYMPPEQADGRLDDIDARSDVYTLGATLYEMLTLRPPFTGSHVIEVIQQVMLREPVSPRKGNPSIDRDLETICLKCLEKDPKRRYPTAKALALDLGRYLEGRPILARPASVIQKLVKRVRRNKTISLILLILALVLCGSAVGVGLGLKEWLREKGEKETAEAEKEEEAQARMRAEDKERETERLRRKAERVSRVLMAAYGDLAKPHVELRDGFYGLQGIEGEMSKVFEKHREEIESFCAGVPKDPASQATMLAVKAWLVRYGGDEEEAVRLLRKAQRLDEEVPWGFFFEAMVWLSQYVGEQPMSGLEFGGHGSLTFSDSLEETPANRDLRVAFSKLIEKVSTAPVWTESSAKDLKEVVEGLAGIHRNDLEAAERGLSKALTVMELSWAREIFLQSRAKVRFSRMQFSKGLEDVERILKDYPEVPGVHWLRGALLYGEGLSLMARGGDARKRFGEAIEAFSRIRGRSLQKEWEYIYLGRARWSLGEALQAQGEDPREAYRNAVEDCTEAVALNPDNGQAYICRGIALWSLGEAMENFGENSVASFQKAIEDFTQAIQRSCGGVRTYCKRSLSYRSLGDARAALGEDPRPVFRLAVADGAEAIAQCPGDAETHYMRGMAYQSLADAQAARGEDPWETYERAIQDLDEAIRLDPDYLQSFLSRATTFLSLGDAQNRYRKDSEESYRRAVGDCREALRLHPRFDLAYNTMGNAWLGLGEAAAKRLEDPRPFYRRAIDAFGRAIAANPGRSIFYQNLGYTYYLNGWKDYRLALEHCAEALRRNPNFTHSFMTRGQICAGLAAWQYDHGEDPRPKFKEAIEAFTCYLQRKPGSAGGYQERGDAYRRLGMVQAKLKEPPFEYYRKAMEDLGRAIRLSPSHSYGYYYRGMTLLKLYRPKEALKDFEKTRSLLGRDVSDLTELTKGARNLASQPPWILLIMKGEDAAHAFDFVTAREAIEKALTAAEKAGAFDDERNIRTLGRAQYFLACFYAMASVGKTGKETTVPVTAEASEAYRQKAIERLREALKLGFAELEYLRQNYELDPLRDMPEFKAILKELKAKLKKSNPPDKEGGEKK